MITWNFLLTTDLAGEDTWDIKKFNQPVFQSDANFVEGILNKKFKLHCDHGFKQDLIFMKDESAYVTMVDFDRATCRLIHIDFERHTVVEIK